VSCLTYHILLLAVPAEPSAKRPFAMYQTLRFKIGGIACCACRGYPTCPVTLTVSVDRGKADLALGRIEGPESDPKRSSGQRIGPTSRYVLMAPWELACFRPQRPSLIL